MHEHRLFGILVALDTDGRAAYALHRACWLAARYDGELHLVHARPAHAPLPARDGLVARLWSQVLAVSEGSGPRSVPVWMHITRGPVAESVLAVADAQDVDVVAVGRGGRTADALARSTSLRGPLEPGPDRPLFFLRPKTWGRATPLGYKGLAEMREVTLPRWPRALAGPRAESEP